MLDRRAALIAKLLEQDLQTAAAGHCVRVNYLDRDESLAICRHLRKIMPDNTDVSVFVLGHTNHSDGDVGITTDRAIELRNRKHGVLCVFVPADLVDATVSSLGNSFAGVDGRDLYRRALRATVAQLSSNIKPDFQSIDAHLRRGKTASDGNLLALALAMADLNTDTVSNAGLELWRVGLISDAGPDYMARLTANRRCVRELSRPQAVGASFRDRIAKLNVNNETARALEGFFARRALSDVQAWSRDLIKERRTFDTWVFPESVVSDVEDVRIKSFMNAHGAVLKSKGLIQPDGPGGVLLARYGEKEKIKVEWVTDPLKPINVAAWQVELKPVSDSADMEDLDFELPSREVKGSSRTTTFRLNISPDEPPETSFEFRIVAIDESGNELVDANGEPIAALSDRFYLTNTDAPPEQKTEPRRKAVASIAEGRLRAAVESRETEITLIQPSWENSKDVTYFATRVNERMKLNIALSPTLLALERRILSQPARATRWSVEVDEVRPVAEQEITPIHTDVEDSDQWLEFVRQRTRFFGLLGRQKPRDVIEAAEWTTELTNAAFNYGQAYGALLDHASGDELSRALDVDTLLVRVHLMTGSDDAIVILPTHPLRVTWFASHAALLKKWEGQLLAEDRRKRSKLLDLDLIADLTPANVPAFVATPVSKTPFVFFKNMDFFHGIALPGDTRDPMQRFRDISTMFSLEVAATSDNGRMSGRLATHIEQYRNVHPYADPLCITLVNPDEGELIADALNTVQPLSAPNENEERAEDELPVVPAVALTAYQTRERSGGLRGIEALRTRQHERRTRIPADFLRPALSTWTRSLDQLNGTNPVDAHVTVISDLLRPEMRAVPTESLPTQAGSLSLYGLVTRFVGDFTATADGARWQYRVSDATTDHIAPHPTAPRYTEYLLSVQKSVLNAIGKWMAPHSTEPVVPTVDMNITADISQLLERIHTSSDWVVTVDRFLGVEYYDSPYDANLQAIARKHLIDFSPEFVDGLGHRMFVTTASQDEVEVVLRRAMDEVSFDSNDESIDLIIQNLKSVSGRLALQAANPQAQGADEVTLGVVLAALHQGNYLSKWVAVPIRQHPDMFSSNARGKVATTSQPCDLMLVSLKPRQLEAVFVATKWRRGRIEAPEDLAQDLEVQMRTTEQIVTNRYFNADRVDDALQRAQLVNVLRFYCHRALRYKLLDPTVGKEFLQNLGRFERGGLGIRSRYEGFVVSLDEPLRRPIARGNLQVHIISGEAFGQRTPDAPRAASKQAALDIPIPADDATPGREVPLAKPEAPTIEAEVVHSTPDVEPPDEESPEPVEIAVHLGEARTAEVVWRPGTIGSPHLYITGIPGQGKSWTILRALNELSRKNVPALVFDFHGQFADEENAYVKVARPTVVDAAQGLQFSPFECTSDGTSLGWNAAAMSITDIFAYVCGLGAIQRDTLFTSIRDAYRMYGFGDASVTTPTAFPTLEDVLRRIETAEQHNQGRNLIARCRPLLEMDIFQPPSDGRSTLIESILNGMVIDFHNLASETLQLAASAFVLRKLYRDMLQWKSVNRLRLVIVLDEAHRLAKDITLPKIMKEGRKFGVAVLVASQGLADFHKDILSNAGTMVAFRANNLESRTIGGYFRGQPGQDLARLVETLGVGEALVQTQEMPFALKTRMYPPDGPVE